MNQTEVPTLWVLRFLPASSVVYHSQVAAGSEASEKYKIMERRLLRYQRPAIQAANANLQ